jgi:hypothetical protein
MRDPHHERATGQPVAVQKRSTHFFRLSAQEEAKDWDPAFRPLEGEDGVREAARMRDPHPHFVRPVPEGEAKNCISTIPAQHPLSLQGEGQGEGKDY